MFTLTTGGLTISPTEEEPESGSVFVCPNSACGKAFTKPLKAVDLQLSPEKTYDACPYCLTRITEADKKTAEPQGEAASGCAHYMGYLYERSTSGDVPDECILCKNLLSCMLKKTKR